MPASIAAGSRPPLHLPDAILFKPCHSPYNKNGNDMEHETEHETEHEMELACDSIRCSQRPTHEILQGTHFRHRSWLIEALRKRLIMADNGWDEVRMNF